MRTFSQLLMSIMRSSSAHFFSHSFIKNGSFVEITLDNRHSVECDDDDKRRIKNESREREKIWNVGKQRHAYSFYIYRMDVALISFYSIIFLKCCQYIGSQLAYYFISFYFIHFFLSLPLFFISLLSLSIYIEISPEGQQIRPRSTPFLLPTVKLCSVCVSARM